MRKYLFIAFALVAGVLAFTSCNKKDNNDPESSSLIKGIKFCCDLDRGQTPVREYLYFGLQDDFEWGMEIYEDQARTKKLSASGDYGTYVLNEEKSYIDMTFIGAFYEEDGEREDYAGQAAHKDGRFTYKFNGDTIYITAENGYTSKYWKK
jgi:hypothetical protein